MEEELSAAASPEEELSLGHSRLGQEASELSERLGSDASQWSEVMGKAGSLLPSSSMLILDGVLAGTELLGNLVPSSDDINIVAGGLVAVEMNGSEISNVDDLYDKIAVVSHQHCLAAGAAKLGASASTDPADTAQEGLVDLAARTVAAGATGIVLIDFPAIPRDFEAFLPIPVVRPAGDEESIRIAAAAASYIDLMRIDLGDQSVSGSELSGIKEDKVVPEMRRVLMKGATLRTEDDLFALMEYMTSFRTVFKEMDEEDCLELCKSLRHRFIAPGQEIYSEGSVEQWSYILVGGTVHIEVKNSRGEKMEDLMRRIDPGNLFGEAALFKDEPRSNAAVAEGWGADVIMLDRGAFRIVEKQEKLRHIVKFLETPSETRSTEDLKDLLLFLGDKVESLGHCPQLSRTPPFFRDQPDEVRQEIASFLTLKRYQKGDQISVKGEPSDCFCILLSGQATTSESRVISEGMHWGLPELQQRGAKWIRTRTAETEVVVAELGRHEFWKATKGKDEAEWQRRYELMRLNLHIGMQDESDFMLAFKTFAIVRYNAGRTIARQGHSLVRVNNPDAIEQEPAGFSIQRIASTVAGRTSSQPVRTSTSGVVRGEIHLDFVLKGKVQFFRKSQFMKTKENPKRDVEGLNAMETDLSSVYARAKDMNTASDSGIVSRELNVLELSLGDCLTGPDLFGGQDEWTCSVVALSEVVILSVPLKELRTLISNDRLRDLQRIALGHNRTRNLAMQGLMRCNTEMNLKPAADERQLFQKMGIPVSLNMGRKLTLNTKLANAMAATSRSQDVRPHTARPAMTGGYQGGATSYRLTQSRRAEYSEKFQAPETARAMEEKTSYLPVSRFETPDTLLRLKALSQPLEYKRTRAVSNRAFQTIVPNKENTFKGAAWCNREMPRYHGAVMAMKRNVKKGENPSFSPWTLRHGVVFALPQVRLDDILFQEVLTARRQQDIQMTNMVSGTRSKRSARLLSTA